MNTNTIVVVLGQSLHLIPMLLITVGCVLLLARTRSGVAILLLVGNLLTLAVSTTFAVFQLMLLYQSISHDSFGRFAAGLQVVSLLGGVLFGSGFILMALHAQQPGVASTATPPSQNAA